MALILKPAALLFANSQAQKHLKGQDLLGPLLNYISNQHAQNPRLNVKNAPKTVTEISIQISEKGRNIHHFTSPSI